jgi:uncharacterized YccA/Bax inhibitor family protein
VSNPVFSNNAVFGEPKRGRGTVINRSPYEAAGAGTAGAAGMSTGTLEQMYGAPAATTRDTGRLTYDDVIVKTGGLLALLVVVAAATWYVAPGLFWIGMIVGLVLGLVNAFKNEPSPALIVAYTVAQGVFLGGISYLFQEMTFDGTSVQPIVLQAVLATAATFAACLVLFRSGKVRVTAKFTRWLLVAMAGYLVFSLVNFGLLMFGVIDGWGMRTGPLGIVIGLAAVGLAAAMLIVDFDSIKRGVEQGVPAKFAWTAAFGLIVTLVWLYLEILRILAIFNRQ